MKAEIKILIIEFLKNKNTVSSWGISSIIISKNGISFEASGFKYKGNVFIEIMPKGYSIKLNDRTIIFTTLEEIILTLDIQIEVGENYYNDITNWLGKQH